MLAHHLFEKNPIFFFGCDLTVLVTGGEWTVFTLFPIIPPPPALAIFAAARGLALLGVPPRLGARLHPPPLFAPTPLFVPPPPLPPPLLVPPTSPIVPPGFKSSAMKSFAGSVFVPGA